MQYRACGFWLQTTIAMMLVQGGPAVAGQKQICGLSYFRGTRNKLLVQADRNKPLGGPTSMVPGISFWSDFAVQCATSSTPNSSEPVTQQRRDTY